MRSFWGKLTLTTWLAANMGLATLFVQQSQALERKIRDSQAQAAMVRSSIRKIDKLQKTLDRQADERREMVRALHSRIDRLAEQRR